MARFLLRICTIKPQGFYKKPPMLKWIALDCRGHGQSNGAMGDVDYIDQYIDDLADVISIVKKETHHTTI